VSGAPDPSEIFQRAVDEGNRRLDQTTLELVSTSFIAGFTVVFGMAALGIAHAAVEPQFGDVSKIAGGLAFGLALVFLVVGRTELFNENFFDPTAAAVDNDDSWMVGPLVRLWALTFVFNFVGGAMLATFVAIEGALPPGTAEALVSTAEDIVARSPLALFASAVFGGALVSLLSFLLQAVDSDGARITLSYMVGFLLALGPFDHVVVSVLHVYFGMLFGGPIGYGALLVTMAVSTAGNFVGGLGLVTVSHVAQVKGSRSESD
jgi:formate/nitrite transporter FocA (FNT family)